MFFVFEAGLFAFLKNYLRVCCCCSVVCCCCLDVCYCCSNVFLLLGCFLLTFQGMISRVLFPNEVACANEHECKSVCGNAQGCSNIAYPKLVLSLLPTGNFYMLLRLRNQKLSILQTRNILRNYYKNALKRKYTVYAKYVFAHENIYA